MARELILASASPARRSLLEGAGFSPRVIVSGVEEDATGTVSDVVEELARRKAMSVAAQLSDGFVLGCDSLLEYQGSARGKPASAAQAIEWWQSMRGQSGILRTGHCLIEVLSGRLVSEVVSTTVQFGSPSDSEIARYVESGEPLHVAGAFTLAGRSAPFIEGVVGDANNVEGLSLAALRRLFAELGVSVLELWTSSA